MKNTSWLFLFGGLSLAILYSCSKSNTFNATGGQLPTNYININDSNFSPATLTVANGSTITFLNKSAIPHTIMSDDSTSLVAIMLKPDSFYVYRPDTATVMPVIISIPYHCVEHPSARGTINLVQ